MEVSDKIREAMLAMGIDPATLAEDYEEDLTAVPQSQWEEGTKITPPAAILRYLQSGDTLTGLTIDMMEIAIEKAIKAEHPWFVTSRRLGSAEAGNLSVDYFYLGREAR